MDSDEILIQNFPFIEFKTIQEKKSIAEVDKRSAVFHLGGEYLGDKTTITQDLNNEKKYYLELGDHGNYDNILEYVKSCDPQLVITDSFHSKWGSSLGKRIKDQLDIHAISKPR